MMTSEFDGATYDSTQDKDRLSTQLECVGEQMRIGEWWTLQQLQGALEVNGINATEASISARIRDLRKEKFGAHIIDRRRVIGARGLFEYRMVA